MARRIEVDEARFRTLWNAGVSVARISVELGIATDSLNRVRARLGLAARTPQSRAKPAEPYRDPTPSEIAERAAAVRKTWTPEIEERRRVSKTPPPYEFPVVRTGDIDDAISEWL